MAIDPMLYKKVTGRAPGDAYKAGPLMGPGEGGMSSWEILGRAMWIRRVIFAIIALILVLAGISAFVPDSYWKNLFVKSSPQQPAVP